MRIKTIVALTLVALLLVGALFIQHRSLTEARQERDRQAQNVRTLTTEARILTFRDSLRAAQVTALVLRNGELEELRAKDAKLIRDLHIRQKDVRTISNLETVIRDTVFLHVEQDGDRDTSMLTFSDRWADLAFCPVDSSVTYCFRDSVTVVQHVAYQRRFLWWRWKPKHTFTVVSHNPRCTLITGVVSIVNDE